MTEGLLLNLKEQVKLMVEVMVIQQNTQRKKYGEMESLVVIVKYILRRSFLERSNTY